MTRANANPWFTDAGATNSIMPIVRFVTPTVFASKTRGYGLLFEVDGADEEGLTDPEIASKMRGVEGGVRGLTEDFGLYRYMRVTSGFEMPRQKKYADPITQSFVDHRLDFLKKTANFRRIDLHWCLTLEPKLVSPFAARPKDQADENDRLISQLQKAATILETHLSSVIGLKVVGKEKAFKFFAELFNLEEWAGHIPLVSDLGVDQQIATSAVSWHNDHLRVGKRHVQMFSASSTPAASQPCLYNSITNLTCDSVLCTTWRPQSSSTVRKEISAQEKWIDFFKVGIFQRVMAGKNFAQLDQGAGAKAASEGVDDLGLVVKELGKKAQGKYTVTLLLSAESAEQLRENTPLVHRTFVDAQATVIEETIGNLSAFYAMFPFNQRYNVFSLWLGEDHHARLSPVFAPNIGHQKSEDLESEYLNVFETRQGTPFFHDAYVSGVRVQLTIGPPGTGKSTLLRQMLSQIEDRGESAIVYDPASDFIQRFYREDRGDVILNPLDARSCYWSPAAELRNPAEARTIAASLYQPVDGKPGEFFTETPQKIFAHLLKYRPSVQDLIAWMSNPDEIDHRVAGTELEKMIGKDSPDQRNGVLGSLGLIADSFRLLPTKKQAKNKEWSATAWAEKREGWIFLTGTEAEQEALRPLHSLWIDLLILRLLTQPKLGQKRAWFVLDELATLQRLPQFHSALTKGRKSDNPIIFGYQGKAQLEVVYGHLAEVMLSQPATKFVMKTAEPKAAKWASELIGDIEIERVRETVADGKRAGKSFTMDRQIEPLVMSSEIQGLEDLHSFLKLGNNVTRFSFPHWDRDLIAPQFVPRDTPESGMWLKSEKPKQPASPVPAAIPQAATTPAIPQAPATQVLTPVEDKPVVKKKKRKTPTVTPVLAVGPTPPPVEVPAFGPVVLLTEPVPTTDL